MAAVIQLVIFLVLGAIFLAATAAIWVQRAPAKGDVVHVEGGYRHHHGVHDCQRPGKR